MSESELKRDIRLALSRAGVVTFNNPVGVAVMATGHTIRYGLARGSSDLIGISSGGMFVALEVKTPTGRATPEQRDFINLVQSRGGIAGIVRSVDDALRLVGASTHPCRVPS